MKRSKTQPKKIAVIGNYLPRKCGIATFTTDLCGALAAQFQNNLHLEAIAMDDIPEAYHYPERVTFQIRANMQADYLRAAEFINVNQFDVVLLQHEYGIFGGKDGSYIFHLLESLQMPIITTLHTVLAKPSAGEKAVIEQLRNYCDQFVIMSHAAESILSDVYEVPADKITFIPHGIPDIPFIDTSFYKDLFNVDDRKVIFTFGLLSPGKGIEYMIKAMPEIVDKHPDAVYIVLGQTHPNIKKVSGESYRHSLLQMVDNLGMEDHVIFHNEFVDLERLCQYMGAADIFVTPYLSEAQIVSGTLAYTLGAGKAVISTPYIYAKELLAEGRGMLAPFRDSDALAKIIIELFSDSKKRNNMRKLGYQFARSMIWKNVAKKYLQLAENAYKRQAGKPKPRYGTTYNVRLLSELPEVKLDHLIAMTDNVGILQHAVMTIPNRHHGYCTDDNARALIVACMYYTMRKDEKILPLLNTYLAFLFHAFDEKSGHFHNFLSYSRNWQDTVGSEDCHGRAIWALGISTLYAPNDNIKEISRKLIVDSIQATGDFISPRALAFAAIGLHSYLRVYGGDALARKTRRTLIEKLYDMFRKNSDANWQWCEDSVTYDNAKLTHALILLGRDIQNKEIENCGLTSLEWLLKKQTAPDGHISIIGNSNWMPRDGKRSYFDQQPLEPMALIQACAVAYKLTGKKIWLEEARRCMEWFIGRNDLYVPIYDFRTGGCRDGLQASGSNANEGAESTLSWLISLLTMLKLSES